jgi:hypothetical protein
MGYFDGLASAIIKKDKNNNSVYYPWGVLGKGYILPNAEKETEIKDLVILFYKIMIGLFFVHIIVLKSIAILVLLTFGLLVWFLIKSQQITKDCPISEEKLTLKEGYTNSAKAHNKTVLWILFGAAILFTLGGIAMLITSKLFILGLLMTLLFGASSAAIFYMIQVKNKQEKEPN